MYDGTTLRKESAVLRRALRREQFVAQRGRNVARVGSRRPLRRMSCRFDSELRELAPARTRLALVRIPRRHRHACGVSANAREVSRLVCRSGAARHAIRGGSFRVLVLLVHLY